MSADNGHVVSKLYNDDYKYGIFYYSASADLPAEWYTKENAIKVFRHPVAAILEAHRIEENNRTEYGVSVHSRVLEDCKPYYAIGWEC